MLMPAAWKQGAVMEFTAGGSLKTERYTEEMTINGDPDERWSRLPAWLRKLLIEYPDSKTRLTIVPTYMQGGEPRDGSRIDVRISPGVDLPFTATRRIRVGNATLTVTYACDSHSQFNTTYSRVCNSFKVIRETEKASAAH